ncbi:conserved membrane hypothetical protein [Flavobacterium psychrophilum]|uniref:coiled-coil domain-containing protein n=1 Tax=Flavobacterium psychrophilum TaxID=96345 RepID=UPI000B7C429D|nr:hypothetical protein [Flavobacterium psychrophilum]SNB23886.1 conserved membrane hypothetical protein [Flavobacterium psychrophilum]
MEFTNHLSGKTDTTQNDIQEQIEALQTQKKERVKSFRDYAFEKAGLNRGDHLSLKNYLKWIKDGHIVDETFNEKEQRLLKQQVENKIATKEEEKEKITCDKKTNQEVSKPTIERKIKELNEEIQQTKIDLTENAILTGYQPVKYIMYCVLTVLLSIYLLLFYASSIYASFFRNASSLLATAGDDIALYLDSIFDVKGIFTASPALLIVYFGACLFFAIGMIPHNIEGKHKKVLIGLALLGALVADCLLAYKIDSGMHNLKVMAGIADVDWKFYSSINFYMVLLFGFCAYLVWGYMFEMMLKEKNKKTGDAKAALIIKGLKLEIKQLKEELKEIEARIIELESQIKTLDSQIEQLKKDLESRMLNPDALSQNLTSFFMGWLQYLNNTGDTELEKTRCDNVFRDFYDSHFSQPLSLN